MAAHEGGEHLGDGRPVVGRVVGDALQRVDAAEPHVQFWVAQLVDGAGKPLGDLTLLRDLELLTAGLELSVGEVGAEQDHGPADALQQGGADVVHGLGLVRWAEGARLSAELPTHEPCRDDEHAGEDHRQGSQAGKRPAAT
jgi:hypothetical protein